MLTVWESDCCSRFGEQGYDERKYLALLMKSVSLQISNKGISTALVDILRLGTVEQLYPRGVLIFQLRVAQRGL